MRNAIIAAGMLVLATDVVAGLFDFLDPCEQLASHAKLIAEQRDKGRPRSVAYDLMDTYCKAAGTCAQEQTTLHQLVDTVYKSNLDPDVIATAMKRGCVQGQRERARRQ